MRWYTCTPVAFGGGPDFFARDSGLLCRGLQQAGCESRAVMPGAWQAEDEADLIRTEYANLESAGWWKSQQLDGVVLYAWGSPKFGKVAKAIHDAGIFLVLNQDNGGLISPLAGFSGWLEEQRILSGNAISYLNRVVRGLTTGLLVTDPLRARHLKQGDVIACVSPAAAVHYQKLCEVYGGNELADRVKMVPHPVEPRFHTTGSDGERIRRIASVGRWKDELQKRPELMCDVFGRLLGKDDTVVIDIAGDPSESLSAWHRSMRPDYRSRVNLLGRVGREPLAEMLRGSQIFYSPSAYESFGIAAGEALCSGCSVVAGRSISMASFGWFVSENSGTLAATDDAEGHLAALTEELENWDYGRRSALSISNTWCSRLHADKVATRLLAMHA